MKRNYLMLVCIVFCYFLIEEITRAQVYIAVQEPITEVESIEAEVSTIDIVEIETNLVNETIVYVEETTQEETTTEPPIDPEELDLLAHLIFAEAGSDWCDDEMLYGVGSVVLNRMASEYFPDNMYDVIYQEGQYACTWSGYIEREPNERAYRIAEDLLRNGSTLPDNVIFQAQFTQGDGVYSKVQNMYFCYIN